MNRKTSALWRGFLQALPIVVGVLPFGITYGAAVAQNMPWWGGMGRIGMSLSNASFWAAIPAALVAWRTRNIMLTILVGMAASAVIQQAVW